MITSGILAAYIVDWGFAGFSNNWRWMFGIAMIPAPRSRSACTSCRIRRAGSWSGGGRTRRERCSQRYRDSDDDVDAEIKEIKDVSESEASVRDL